MKEKKFYPGIGGFVYALCIKDLNTSFRYAAPVGSKDASETTKAITFFKGRSRIELMTSDDAPEYEKACSESVSYTHLTLPTNREV